MQTTLRIQDDLYREAKSEAAREGVTLTRFLESALRLRLQLSRSSVAGTPHFFPVHVAERPLELSNEELKRFDQEEELQHDMRKLGSGPNGV
jgi:hypothetical protein